ncbi:MAG: UDP-3-O-(3-hydroxymyristoyl)glucosamine N-acyltransferase [Gammaproteobacteria bacterium]|nr:UDP-3-O-(3-hydroxymyristoyl)glucosamine N-acyltransferase [Gammaproteobacteria bacterium]
MDDSLQKLADIVDGKLIGTSDTLIRGVANIAAATEGDITFLVNEKFLSHLAGTKASAVILKAQYADECPVSAIVVDDPYLSYAKIATFLTREKNIPTGIHPTAVVSDTAVVDATAWVGPNVVIEDGAVINAGVRLEGNCYIGKRVIIGKDTQVKANVAVYYGTEIGERCLFHCGAVIGSDGFGLANDNGSWFKIPQLGNVIIANDVEIGANSAIDRGAIDNTIIHDGVKIDNLVHIAHNVEIGEHTALAACVGIAGSTKIGKHCTAGGGAAITGHIEIADNVHLGGMAMVTKAIKEAGAYSSGIPAEPASQWRKNVVRFRQFEKMEKRIKLLENELKSIKGSKIE